MKAGRFWDRWLTATVVAVLLYSTLLVVAGGAAARVFDVLRFGMAQHGVEAGVQRDYVLFVYGVLGAVLIGWMGTLLPLVRGPLRRRERWAWSTVAGAVAIWFVVDTSFSLAVGQREHAVFNLLFAVAFGVPLAAIRPSLAQSEAR